MSTPLTAPALALPNPVVRLYDAPVETLATLAYALVLLGVTVALAGKTWDTALWTANAVKRRENPQVYGDAWSVVPPAGVYLRVFWTCLLAAAECLLVAGLIHIAFP